jgi:sugar lactone lactonase YvrE
MRTWLFALLASSATALATDRPQIEDRTGAPLLPASALERVAELELPPGNVAVTSEGRVFFTFHPAAKPDIHVAELVDGAVVPFPDLPTQSDEKKGFDTPLSVRVDRQGRLWILDYAGYRYGGGSPRLTQWDVETRQLLRRYDFSKDLAPRGSMLNDFQIDPEGEWAYIADASPLDRNPALVALELRTGKARRLLEGHPGVVDGPYGVHVDGKEVKLWGAVTIHYGVDSIALDRKGKWLYFASLNAGELYRVRAETLREGTPAQVQASVEHVAPITLSDGITTDSDGNIYITDMEHSAVVRLREDGKLETLLKSPELRWPDGFSFGPGGWLYLACSSLQDLFPALRPNAVAKENGPYPLFRFKPGHRGFPGH